MAIEIKEYMELTGLTEGPAKAALARGDEYAKWHIPAGAAKIAAKTAMVTELLTDDTNGGTIITEVEPNPTGDAGAGEGEDEGDGADLD